jgi:hypothetical protein
MKMNEQDYWIMPFSHHLDVGCFVSCWIIDVLISSVCVPPYIIFGVEEVVDLTIFCPPEYF